MRMGLLLVLVLAPASAFAHSARFFPEPGAGARGAQRSAVTFGAQAPRIRLAVAETITPPPPPPLLTPESSEPAGELELAPDPDTLPTGIPLMVTGGVLMGIGVNSLVLGVVYLLGGLAADSIGRGSSGASVLTVLGVGFSLGGAALIGSGAYVFFRGRAQRAALNRARELRAVEGITARYEPRNRAVVVGYRFAF